MVVVNFTLHLYGATWYSNIIVALRKLYTLSEVRDYIGGDPPPAITTLERWAREGRLPVVRLSARVIRVDHDALQEFITSNSGTNTLCGKSGG